jgi:hypothetical protein
MCVYSGNAKTSLMLNAVIESKSNIPAMNLTFSGLNDTKFSIWVGIRFDFTEFAVFTNIFS